MGEHDEVYGRDREQRLVEMLLELAALIRDLDQRGELLGQGAELLRRMGDIRSELFHYEVRSTYDTPEVAENRRIVEEASGPPDFLNANPEDDEPWRRRSE